MRNIHRFTERNRMKIFRKVWLLSSNIILSFLFLSFSRVLNSFDVLEFSNTGKLLEIVKKVTILSRMYFDVIEFPNRRKTLKLGETENMFLDKIY